MMDLIYMARDLMRVRQPAMLAELQAQGAEVLENYLDDLADQARVAGNEARQAAQETVDQETSLTFMQKQHRLLQVDREAMQDWLENAIEYEPEAAAAREQADVFLPDAPVNPAVATAAAIS
jgi:hypothetical protein